VDRVSRVLAELDMAAKRPLKRSVGRLGHQQRPIPRSPDDGHGLHDDLPLQVYRTVVSRRPSTRTLSRSRNQNATVRETVPLSSRRKLSLFNSFSTCR
jgi:hypothetical protein